MTPKVLIGIPTGELARNAKFYDFLHILEKPEGSLITTAHGQSPARNRNQIIEQAIKHDMTHVLFLDDDMAFPADTLKRLLEHDLDVVTGLYLMRNFPHKPVIFDFTLPDGKAIWHALSSDKPGLVEIVNAGLGCCLVKVDVFKKVPKPWVALGQLDPENWCDDFYFFDKVKKYGYKIFCDTSVLCGHMAVVTIWPSYRDGKWFVNYDTEGPEVVTMPMPFVRERGPVPENENDQIELEHAK